MLKTRQELITEYDQEKLTDKAIFNNQYDTYILVEWDQEHVFGYHKHYQRNKKDFFKVKAAKNGNDITFKRDGEIFKISQFESL
jgi:hypothetical protein